MNRSSIKAFVPWLIAVLFGTAFAVLLVAQHGNSSNDTGDVTQDSSGHRVTAWVDPMYSQGPPHLYKSNHPGRAPDCGMKLVPVYADASPAAATGTSSVSGYAKVSLPEQRQRLIGVTDSRCTAAIRSWQSTVPIFSPRRTS